MALDHAAVPALAIDTGGVAALKSQARQDPSQALRGAAREFETMFMNMLMKSMRDANPQDGMFDSDQTRLYQSMLDQQMAQAMAKRGIGLAEIMVKQLANGNIQDAARTAALGAGVAPSAAGAAPADPNTAAPAFSDVPAGAPAALTAPAAGAASDAIGSGREFADRMWPHAAEASRTTGIPAHFMLGQAALESGWGKREIRGADGAQSFNLFGIKAGRGWNGPTVEAPTTEYVNGTPVKTTARFRTYGSYAESFRDYAKFLSTNPRYAGVIDNAADAAGFARNLQKAGYATDPQYADKLTRIINGSVLRQSLAA